MAELPPLPGPSQLHGSSEPPAKKQKADLVDEPTGWEWSPADGNFQWKFADGWTMDYVLNAQAEMWNLQEVALSAAAVGGYWKVGQWRDEPLARAKPVYRREPETGSANDTDDVVCYFEGGFWWLALQQPRIFDGHNDPVKFVAKGIIDDDADILDLSCVRWHFACGQWGSTAVHIIPTQWHLHNLGLESQAQTQEQIGKAGKAEAFSSVMQIRLDQAKKQAVKEQQTSEIQWKLAVDAKLEAEDKQQVAEKAAQDAVIKQLLAESEKEEAEERQGLLSIQLAMARDEQQQLRQRLAQRLQIAPKACQPARVPPAMIQPVNHNLKHGWMNKMVAMLAALQAASEDKIEHLVTLKLGRQIVSPTYGKLYCYSKPYRC